MRELDRRDFLKLAGGTIGLGAMAKFAYETKRFLAGDAEKEERLKEEWQHILTTTTSHPTLTGWKLQYPRHEPGVTYQPAEGMSVDIPANSEITLSGHNHTGVYLTDFHSADQSSLISLNLQEKDASEWFLLQPPNRPLKDEHASTGAIQFAHPQLGFLYLGIWNTGHLEHESPVYRVSRMDRYHGR